MGCDVNKVGEGRDEGISDGLCGTGDMVLCETEGYWG